MSLRDYIMINPSRSFNVISTLTLQSGSGSPFGVLELCSGLGYHRSKIFLFNLKPYSVNTCIVDST